jgi:hypothetical protein
MQIANEFGREGGGGLTSITGYGPPPEGFSYETKPISHDIALPGQAYIPPQAIPGGPDTPSPGGLLPSLSSSGGAFIIGMIILGMSGFRA